MCVLVLGLTTGDMVQKEFLSTAVEQKRTDKRLVLREKLSVVADTIQNK